ncbi:homospermidine synthase [Candidatus Kaiserbacteria bacterium]|nr:homospermidine synthase [Candidatus Kaiserbacteria bacterium]
MKKPYQKYVTFSGRLLIVGFGSIGSGVLPLILRHIAMPRKHISIITGDKRGAAIAKKEKISFRIEPLTKKNFKKIIDASLGVGDFLLNLSVDVSSVDLIEHCQKRGILYLDTVVEPWAGGYADPTLSLSDKSNYGLREKILALRNRTKRETTAVSCHGANPGIVSHFVKCALLQIAKDTGHHTAVPGTKQEWGMLMRDLGVKVVHIAEYDSQTAPAAKEVGRFENTWSVDGFYSEGINQPCEMGWGTHEKNFPADGRRHTHGSGAGIYLTRPGAATLVRTWTPEHGAFFGRAVTHNESISIADYYSLRKGSKTVFRPTVHYAYRPCDVALLSVEECLGNVSIQQKEQRILMDEIDRGMDELGVLLMGHKKGAYWYGSQLTIEQARRLAPYQNATGLQVTAGVLGGMIWAMEHPRAGIVEADEMDFKRIMEIITPYLGRMTGRYTNWTPLANRKAREDSSADFTDPWQFNNFRFF